MLHLKGTLAQLTFPKYNVFHLVKLKAAIFLFANDKHVASR